MQIPIAQIADSIEANSENVQVGSIDDAGKRILIRTLGKLDELAQIEHIVVTRTLQGSAVYLKDIATIKDSFQKEEQISRFQGEPRVMLSIQKESGANILRVSENIQRELDRLKRRIAGSAVLEIAFSQADFIEASIRRLRNEAIIGGGLAMVIILLFLRNLKGVVIVSTAIPISIMATLSLMYFFGITLNVITLAGFTLGVGMLLDNAIVVLENIVKKRHRRYNDKESSILGTAEVSRAIATSTVAHIAVFLPVIFLQKKIWMLYSGLFFTVSFSLVASLLVALTLIPVCSTWLKIRPSPQPKKKSFYHRAYRRGLLICLRNRGIVVAAAAVIFGASLLLIPEIGFEQMAQVDRGVFDIIVKNRPGTRLAVTNDVAKNLERVIQQVPEVRDVSSSVAGETASLRVRLVPAEVRTKTTRQVAEELRPKVTAIPDSQVHFDIERQVSSGKVIEIEVKGYDQRALMFLSLAVKQRLLGVKGITDVVVHQGNPKPEIQIRVLHDKAGLYGLSATQIAYAVRSSITGPLPTELYQEGKEIDLRVRLRDEDIKGLSVLEDLAIPVLAEDGQTAMVSLSEVSRFNLVQGMAEIHRKDRNRMIKISAEVAEANLLETIDNVKATLDTFKFPKGYGYNFGEKYQEIRENQKEMIFAFCMAITLVYMILASLFESFVYPLTIMFSVPMAIVGSVLTLYFTGKPISVPVYVGAITMAGIAVNNSLVLVDYVKLLKTRGAKRWRAIIKGGESRLRPILMTSGTTLLALLPMAIDKGQGSNLWSPLALTIIGGLFTSTILTLFILPVLVSFLRDQN